MRSFMSRFASFYLRITRVHDHNYQKEINKIIKRGEVDWNMPKKLSDDIVQESFDGMKVFYVNKNSSFKNVLFYIHGGYYINQPLNFHIKMLKKILEDGNTMLVFPLYPKTPWHTVEESFDKMVTLFKKVQEDYADKKIILSGDSAGGGYSLAVAESLEKQPDELILLSPWVDITMKNENIKDYIKVDPMLSTKKAQYAGNAWRGKLDENYYRVSPINGDLFKLQNVTIFVGTREIFRPDNSLLYNKLIEANAKNINIIVGTDQNHVYPAFPTKEGHQAIKQIVDIINR